jgi:hypothetical protein
VHLQLEDARVLKDMSQVGDGTSDEDELFAWRASTSVGDFAREVLTATAAGWGVTPAPNSDTTLVVRLTRFWVSERNQAVGSTYAAEVFVTGTLKNASDEPVAQFSGAGDARRYGKPRSPVNCMEVLSDALKEAYASLMTDKPTSSPAAATPDPSNASGEPMTPAALLGEVLKLRSSGFSNEALTQYVNQRSLSAAFAVTDMIAWKDAGISEELIRAAMSRPVVARTGAP